jgi:hypothetical protein
MSKYDAMCSNCIERVSSRRNSKRDGSSRNFEVTLRTHPRLRWRTEARQMSQNEGFSRPAENRVPNPSKNQGLP